ncbi:MULTISPECIES: hypothetical protein [unclassified Pseudomonas]|uniref:hypothetical protein n=1 Tax=unclassified Pseudomonas TaxID=196821 RepID=UPI000731ACD7|nr:MULTISPECIES: hypothetical protein [unclassified Pseudomonas]KSW22760.1 hypothetical protein AOX63_04900 [Pseudomonas sp. ADP]KSW28465.1 hypothetical protein AOX63_00230 [Pseudomonas sp. ADP]QOF85691.1 hypothetical protein IG194_03020 [Pseudomonas sp. ADPe]
MDIRPQVRISMPQTAARRTITLALTRDGEQTSSVKVGLLLDIGLSLLAVFATAHQQSQTFLASAIDGSRLLLAVDQQAPARAAARYPSISEDVTLDIDLNDGSGSGGGAPADLAATVRVDGLPADRDVVAFERGVGGEWRVAGYGATVDGELDMDLRVAGPGQVYVMAMDSWGTVFQPLLGVAEGDLIRPTVFMGWIYRITQAGQLPAVEPTWWDDSLLGPQPLGTARAEVHRYYPPQGRGPIPVELT